MKDNVIKISGGIMINVNESVKKHYICEKDYIQNPNTCICENGKYLASIMDDSVITCDEILEATVPTNFNEKVSIFYLHFY